MEVLVVEDDIVARTMVVDALRARSLTVREAGDWFETMEVLRHHEVGVLVLDVRLPGLSGSKIASIVTRRHAASPKVILHSSVDPAELAELAEQVGARRWFGKGTSLEVVADAVEAELRAWSAEAGPVLPFSRPPIQAPEPEGGAPPAVLLVDDDEDLLELTRELLEEAGMRVGTAVDWVSLARELFLDEYGVVLLDVVLPSVTGDELVGMIREIEGCNPRVVLWSAHDIDHLAALATQAGADAFVAKGRPQELLVEQVRQELARYASASSSSQRA